MRSCAWDESSLSIGRVKIINKMSSQFQINYFKLFSFHSVIVFKLCVFVSTETSGIEGVDFSFHYGNILYYLGGVVISEMS